MQDLTSMVRSARAEQMKTSNQWTLGRLIAALREVDSTDDCYVSFAFGDFVPTTCDSWRGSYHEIAIGFEELVKWDSRPLLASFLSHLDSCVGKTFEGWKGGEYVMDESTPVWVANPGKSGRTGVIGIHEEKGPNGTYNVVIRTDYCPYLP